MRLGISEARRRLPELVRRVQKGLCSVVRITVLGEDAAELRAAGPEDDAGEAARVLFETIGKLPKRRGRAHDVSSNVKEHLYGSRR